MAVATTASSVARAAAACVVSARSCAIAPDGRSLLVHALHLEDADALVADIKQRYEAPLEEIFA